MMTAGRGFERWLYLQVHGRPAPRRSPRRPRRGPARSRVYMAWMRQQPSCLTGAFGCEAAHTGSDGGMRQKASDWSCVPLTVQEHREYHRIGRDAMELKYGVIFADVAATLSTEWEAAQ